VRSLIRSALASLPPKAKKKTAPPHSSATYFASQARPVAPSAKAGKAAQDGYAALLKQLNVLRSHLKKDAPSERFRDLIQIKYQRPQPGRRPASGAEKRRQANLENALVDEDDAFARTGLTKP